MDYIYEMPSAMLKECSKKGTVERFDYDTFTYYTGRSTRYEGMAAGSLPCSADFL